MRVVNQLAHDLLQTFLELPAIFRARDDQREIKRQDAFVFQKRWDFAAHDSLRETFDDSCLADAGFADQHRIILRAAAENLHDALDFGFTPDEWIELISRRIIRQVARKLDEVRRIFLGRGARVRSRQPRDHGRVRAERDRVPRRQRLVVLRHREVLVDYRPTFEHGVPDDGAFLDPDRHGHRVERVRELALGLRSQRQLDTGGNLFTQERARFDVLAHRFDVDLSARKESARQRLVFTHQAKE